MRDSNSIKKIRDLILPILESQNIDLVDVEFKGKSGYLVLRIFVDIDGGITLNQCANLSQQISDLLDTKDLISGRYRLEVSSPGLDRPLKTARDFQRNLGRKAKVRYFTDKGEDNTISGTIEQVDDSKVFVKQNNHRLEIDICRISVAKIIPIW
ncbi:MAG: ribosome maturation factor RimP [bacterium]|nr:MAG: ribosome maturation factor RimP [bacterium]